ncbi:DUF58 domain-containing protein [Ruminococcus sp. OA3]|uniref:DUF58 domain-containing protein n=1 Tax=Ruminococcus sp. OA3 TaxID=2914164 RepID=UPI001F06B52B|nr:DUF58 domain-containing protein [Ruminococcus sp. OA3]MCH1981766.1 DUF58 domain-containing protein [Ruminococcus sp. OA3]
MRRNCYVIFSALTFYLAGVYRSNALMMLFVAELFFLVGMFLLSRYLSGRLDVRLELESDTVPKGESVTGRVWVSNRSRLPAAQFEVELEYYNPEIAVRGTKKLYGYMAGHRQPVKMEFQAASRYCGILHVGIRRVRVYDYLMLFRGRSKKVEDLRVLVFPSGRPVKIEADWNAAVIYPSGGEPRPDMPGSQPPELYQIRQYQDGDSMRDIHWKLSAKMDQMMSRQFAAESQCTATIYLDFRKSGDEDIRRLDAFCELSASVLHGFLDAGREFRVCWHDMEKKSGEEKMIRNEEDYRGMLKEIILCASYSGGAGENLKEMPEVSQFLRPDETILCLNMKLQLFLDQQQLAHFSEEDYEQELEKGWFSG